MTYFNIITANHRVNGFYLGYPGSSASFCEPMGPEYFAFTINTLAVLLHARNATVVEAT